MVEHRKLDVLTDASTENCSTKSMLARHFFGRYQVIHQYCTLHDGLMS